MQAVILAGGLGTRLRPYTYDIPKPMVDINNRPFLEHLINNFKKYKITEFLILTSYLGEKIGSYFGTGKKFGVNITYSREESPLGTGGALKNGEKYLKDVFILANGDTFTDTNLDELIDFFKKQDKLACIVVKKTADAEINNIKLKDNNIIDYKKNAKSPEYQYVDIGIFIAKKEITRFFPNKEKFSFEEEVFPILIKNQQLAAFVTEKNFYDMGTKERLEKIKKVLV